MANHLKGEVPVKALGKDLVFRLGVNEMIELQNALGLADKDDVFLSIFDEDKLRNLGRIRKIVLFALKHRQSDITEDQAGELINEVGLPQTGELIKQCLRWAAPEKEQAGVGGPPPRPSDGPPS